MITDSLSTSIRVSPKSPPAQIVPSSLPSIRTVTSSSSIIPCVPSHGLSHVDEVRLYLAIPRFSNPRYAISPILTILALSVSSPAVQTSTTVPFDLLITAAPSVVPAYRKSGPMASTDITNLEGMPSPPPPPPVVQQSSREN